MNEKKWEEFRKKHGLHNFTEIKAHFRGVMWGMVSFIPDRKLAKERYDYIIEMLECLE